MRGSEWTKILCDQVYPGSLAVDFAHVTSPDEI
jgi:hypothetical protein